MTIQSVDMADAQTYVGRRCKTAPLREALARMTYDEAIHVDYYNAQTGEGYRPSTVAQVVGSISRSSETMRFSVRKDATKTGCYVLCLKR
jgi:hypothetical protein